MSGTKPGSVSSAERVPHVKVLAEEFGNSPVLIAFITAKEGIPKKFLESILLDLRNHSLLQSQKGKGGGYRLRLEPERINLAPVIRVIVYKKTTLSMLVEGDVSTGRYQRVLHE